MEISNRNSNSIRTSLLVGSVIFLSVALAEVILGVFKIYADSNELEVHWINTIPFPPSIFSGLVILVIGLIWLAGYLATCKNHNANGYLSVGTILAFGFILLFILILLTDIFNAYVLKMDDYDGWTILSGLQWIFFLSPIPIFYIMKYREIIVPTKKKEELIHN